MFRKACTIALIGLLFASTAAWADENRSQAQPSTSRSSGKRIAWTVIGAAAGFGAGVFLGLNAFDDATDSDRKVWTTALVGAAAGGLAGAFISRNVGRTPRTAFGTPKPLQTNGLAEISWESALRPPSAIEPPRSRGAGLGAEHAHDR
jgi:cytochrome bd-type quinol oxidase subunit 2